VVDAIPVHKSLSESVRSVILLQSAATLLGTAFISKTLRIFKACEYSVLIPATVLISLHWDEHLKTGIQLLFDTQFVTQIVLSKFGTDVKFEVTPDIKIFKPVAHVTS
jgi:hypothetical protein